MSAARPLSHDEFARRMSGLGFAPEKGAYAVAVSGGADSLALMLLAHTWCGAGGVTFDHGLRKASKGEAEKVHAMLAEKGIAHTTLSASERPPPSNQQEWARDARYAALLDWCQENGIENLLLAHHLDDQAETVLMRLLRGSGVDGLAAMQAVTHPRGAKGPALVRPLLHMPKERLAATVRQAGLTWIEDPANRDEKYLRTRVRDLMEQLKVEGFDAARLARTAGHMARAKEALDRAACRAAQTVLEREVGDSWRLDCKALGELPLDLQYRILRRLLSHYGGARPPRFEKLDRLHAALVEKNFRGQTVHGTLFTPAEGAYVLVSREPVAIGNNIHVKPGETLIWDGRACVRYRRGPGPLMIAPLGKSGQWPDNLAPLAGPLPQAVAAALPAFLDAGEIVAVPDLDYTGKAYDIELSYPDVFGTSPVDGE